MKGRENIRELTDLLGGNSRENRVLQLFFRNHSFCFGRKLGIPKIKLNSRLSATRFSDNVRVLVDLLGGNSTNN